MSNLKVLITKLSPPTRTALEKSANFCINQLNYEIEIEHLFVELLNQNTVNDLHILLKKNNISPDALITDLKETITSLPKGNTRTPIFAKSIVRLFEQAWLLASAEQTPLIRSSHLLIALLTAPDLQQIAFRASSLFELFPIDTMKHKFLDICGKSSEQAQTENTTASAVEPTEIQSTITAAKTPALDQYTINLTEKAKNGGIDPVIGREFEIRLMLDILMRRRQNNPILTGEPGVGKTAVVEGLALKIAQGLVPEALKNVQLHVLDMGLLQAGASVKGEFENRLKQVIQEVQASAHPIILFIDEAHTLIGAGGQAGQNDAANLLKPALARGELRTIAATTWAEYKQYFEKDAALSRRFQVVKIEEPTEDVAIDMLRAMIPVMQSHFNLHIDDQAIITAVQASHRYISGRQLPDKAVSVLDTASARVALTQNAQPVILDQLKAQQHNLKLEHQILTHEHQQFPVHHQRLDDLNQQLSSLETEIQETETKWQQELGLVKQIQQLNAQAETDNKTQIASLRAELAQLQGQTPLVFERVNAQIVNEIIADWTGIPVGNMVNDEIKQILTLEDKLGERVMGQDYALAQLVQGIKTSKAKLEDPNKPQGVFILIGPSGVGKTETALALANELYGGEQHLITINMSEYQEAHTVSSLKGAPPGYVGYGQGGVLTEAVRRNPYSVVLLDEIEKAHSDVQELFYQVFDKGMLEDGEGRVIDFKNTTILLTSNTGSSAIMQACLNQPVEDWPHAEDLIEHLKPSLYKQFKPAFIGRMRIVPYFPLHDELLVRIIKHKLGKIVARIEKQYAAKVQYSDDLIELLLSRCTEVDSGARNVDNILNSTVLPALATEILVALAEHKLPKLIVIDTKDDEITYQLDPVEKATKKRSSKKAKAEV
ncbi:ClpV1 family type VI secretion ATPase [Acinetobacter sp. ANC 3929]|uniref:type VI secretion system ATPase TssH n=1 Tax=unclassified Acinetobacter TaxID=196816 RepID=UPI0002D053C3|nr:MULTISPECIES: type VI secretion system ATPase TssH [unclassified Acinetobacter]ENW80528.1 ClpV1 family type VI secretion ATPase [Acinetobacter sp. ANC 3929]MCH7352828.1 type VI secretion system ATPase TssH [Acinetobacter sp. NIPH 2023]MCH7354009.1 type VI secretion system ATPase TssH [Acinetobacter sp. NIPH 1958]MCH7360485.1 type VI secretion system ATPase TssH [Acinetobacter sp. NIPH 2024]